MICKQQLNKPVICKQHVWRFNEKRDRLRWPKKISWWLNQMALLHSNLIQNSYHRLTGLTIFSQVNCESDLYYWRLLNENITMHNTNLGRWRYRDGPGPVDPSPGLEPNKFWFKILKKGPRFQKKIKEKIKEKGFQNSEN